MTRRRIVIVGGGIAGAACAWGLVTRPDGGDDEVLVLEREALLGAHSTSKNAGILRTLTEDAVTTALALETAAFLADPPPGFSDVPLVDPVGLALVWRSFDRAELEAWRAHKAPGSVSEPSAAELHRLAPHYRGELSGALFVHDEGHLDAGALLNGLVRDAEQRGATFRTGAAVRRLVVADGRVTGVELADGATLAADVVVLAAGGWAGALGRAAGSRLELEPRRRHLLVTAADDAVDARWPVLWSEPDSFYVKPESGGLMVCACDQDAIDPDRCDALPEVRELVAGRALELLDEAFEPRAAHFWAGMRTFCRDKSFAVGWDPDVPGLFWVAGLGGHGMSTSIGVARFAAAALHGDAAPDVERALSPARFEPSSC